MKSILGASPMIIGVSAAALAAPACAQDAVVGGDVLAGVVRDQGAGGGDRFSGGVLPSVQFGDETFVLQADGMAFSHAGDGAYGGAAHAGARLGENGYVGLYGSLSSLDRAGGLATRRVGGEVSVGSGKVSVTGVAGYEHTEAGTVYLATTATDDVYDVYGKGGKVFAFADFKLKPSENAVLSVGYRRNAGADAAAASAVFRVSPNVALVFQGRAGEHGYTGAFAGLRIVLGGRRESGSRELLDNRLIEDLFAPGNTRRTLLDPLPPPPEDPDTPGDCGSCGGYCEA